MSNPKDEATQIINAIFESYGTAGITRGEIPYVDARSAITEMKEHDFPGWKDVEWGSYHLKFVVKDLCNDFLEMIDYGDRRYHFKGNYLWDVRYHADGRYNVPMGDIEDTNRIITDSQGLGILIFDIHANSDIQKSFVEWHESLKGGPSSYTIQRETEGRREQPRKTDYFIKKVIAYFFTSSDVQNGINQHWLKTSFQGGFRNSDGTSRKGKYMLDTRYIPPECLLLVKNFNEDPEEFAEDYPDFI
jgi:hypothetical protein